MSFRVIKTGEWERAIVIMEGMPKRLPKAIDQALEQESHRLANIMLRRIDGAEGMAPHKPLTLAIRRAQGFTGTKILIRSGTLRGSIKVVPFGGGYFVGVKRGARARNMSIVDLAKLHEEGKSWRQEMTDKQRRFLFAMLKEAGNPPRENEGSGDGILEITIPARPFIGPAIKEFERDFEHNLERRVGLLLAGDLGHV